MNNSSVNDIATPEREPESPSRRKLFTLPAVAAPVVAALTPAVSEAAVPGAGVNNQLHIIQRITMGVTNELYDEVKAMGINNFIDQQLAPESLDDSATEAMVSQFPRMNMSAAALIAENRRRVVQYELHGATVVRAVHSRRQLQEVMVDFWSNHFNVDTNKKRTAMAKVQEDQTFRSLALGKFSDLLMASAKSPAMLEYLDNRSSRADRGRIPNENYARELMELHTLGVDGGYNEDDVLAVAYVLSGWSVDTTTFQFKFLPARNKLGPLSAGGNVLGWVPVSAEGTVENGESFLNFLAHHASTARFVCWKLCRHFVSDEISMSDALVTKAVNTYNRNDTAIAPVLRTILRSKTFKRSKGQKVKRSNELLYALLRSTGATLNMANPQFLGRDLRNQLIKLGQPLFEAEPPTGYPGVAAAYINTNTLVNRWNLGFTLMTNQLSRQRVQVDTTGWLDSPRRMKHLINQLSARLLNRQLEAPEKQALYDYLGKSARDLVTDVELAQVPALAGLIFATSTYQIR